MTFAVAEALLKNNLSFSPFLQILEKVKATYDVPIVTDVHESIQVKFVCLFSEALSHL